MQLSKLSKLSSEDKKDKNDNCIRNEKYFTLFQIITNYQKSDYQTMSPKHSRVKGASRRPLKRLDSRVKLRIHLF